MKSTLLEKYEKSRFKVLSLSGLIASVGFISTLSTQASLVTINNPSFESPVSVPGFAVSDISGWDISGSAGVWDPIGWGLTAQADSQIGWINGWVNAPGTISQTLNATLQPNSTYNLSIQVVGRKDGYNPGTAYSISLYAGSSLLTSVTPVAPTSGIWTQLKTTYSTGGSLISSDPLEIVISSSAFQLDFDNV